MEESNKVQKVHQTLIILDTNLHTNVLVSHMCLPLHNSEGTDAYTQPPSQVAQPFHCDVSCV